jgi:two-component system, cell cycle sensor histidine kinase and response regulator CckA
MASHPLREPEQSGADAPSVADEPGYLSLVAHYSRDLIALIEPAGTIRYASRSFGTVLGYGADQLIGRSLFTLLHPADLASLLEQWPQLAVSSALQFSCRAQHAGGAWCWLTATLEAHPSDPELVVFVAQDVTERRGIERQLARLLRQNDLILNSITEGMFGVDVSGTTTFINTAAARDLGWDPVQFLGRPAHIAVPHARPDGSAFEEHDSPILETLRGGGVHRVTDGVFWRADGRPLPVDYVCTPVVQSGTVVGAVVVFRDVSERRELQAQVLQSQKMESIGQLAGGLAHDFNNLLTGIIGYANLAAMLAEPESVLIESLQEIERSAYRAAGLTRQLLTFARKQVIELRPMLVNDLLAELEKLLRHLIGPDITFELRLGDAGVVLADPGQLSQVVINLVVNARDAMPTGGQLTLQTSDADLREDDDGRPAHLAPGRYVELGVRDTGSGMSPEVMERIFEPFFTTKEPGAGTGLGLATCYGIVQQHRGAISVSSSEGTGTIFRVYIPRASDDEELPADGSTESVDVPGGSETILVAEDDDTVRRLVTSVLREAGYDVLEAADGERALEAVRAADRAPIDLLIADIVMPRMRGTALARHLSVLCPSARVLFISGQIDDEIVQHGQLLPGLSFLPKPFSARDLLRKVRQVLDG